MKKISLYVSEKQLEVIKFIIPHMKTKVKISDFYREGADKLIEECLIALKKICESNTKGEN